MTELRPLTPEQLARAEARLRNPPKGSRIEAAQKYGIDLTLLISSLRLTPAERARRMEENCELMIRNRGATRRDRLSQAACASS
jgi:hypothetical protein